MEQNRVVQLLFLGGLIGFFLNDIYNRSREMRREFNNDCWRLEQRIATLEQEERDGRAKVSNARDL